MHSSFFRLIVCWFLTIGTFTAFSNQAKAQEQNSILRFVPKDVAFFAVSFAEIKPDTQGGSLERWLAQPEIQASYADLTDFLTDLISLDSDAFTKAAGLVPKLVFGKPWVVFLETESITQGHFKFLVELGELEADVTEAFETIRAESDEELEMFTLKDHLFYRGPLPDDQAIEFGIFSNHFFVAIGNGELEKLIARIDASAALEIESLKQDLPIDRLSGYALVDLQALLSVLDPEGEVTANAFHLDEIKRITAAFGIEGEETVGRMKFSVARNAPGLATVFDVSPLKMEDLKGVPNTVNSASAIKFSLQNLWNLLVTEKAIADELAEFLQTMDQDFSIDFQEDVVESFGDMLYTYQELSMINPAASGIFSLRLKDPAQFAKRLPALLENLEDSGDEFFYLEIEETRNGPLYQLVPFEPELAMAVPAICFQVIGDDLIIGLDPKAISSHLRRVDRGRNRLIDDDRVASLWNSQGQGLGQPIGFYYADIAGAIEGVYAFLPLFANLFSDALPVEFDMDMLPPLEAAVNGILPDLIALYRTEDGIEILETSTLPGLTTATPLLIGMLLPAVQQVREAARRASSMNNIRQLALACLNWESAYQALPPAFNTDQEGQPLLSWRVHILPFIEAGDLYDQFRLDEPWDSPHNFALIEKMPAVYGHPKLNLEPGKTVYLGVTGDGALFVPPRPVEPEPGKRQTGRRLGEIVDGTSNTLMIVEANADHAVYWTKPDDLNIDQIEDIVEALRGNWQGQLLVGMADGSIPEITELDGDKLQKMATVAGREVIER